jgi:amicoumacin kinase
MKINEQVLYHGAQRFGLPADKMRFLGGMDGAVYECRVNEQEFVLKFEPTSADKAARIEEKFRFIHYLAEHGVSVSYPIPSRAGRLVELVTEDDQIYAVTHSPKAPGAHIDTRSPLWTPDFIGLWGQTLGQMHRLAKSYPVWRKPVAPQDPPTAIIDWQDEMQSFSEWCQEDDVRQVWHRLRDELSDLPVERERFGLIHNDAHPWNMLYDGKTLTMIDFDVAAYHWFMTDIGIAIFHGLWQHPTPPDPHLFVRQFLEGYALQNHLPQAWLDRLPLFLRYRQTLSCIVFTNVWTEGHEWQQRLIDDLHRRVHEDRPIIEFTG